MSKAVCARERRSALVLQVCVFAAVAALTAKVAAASPVALKHLPLRQGAHWVYRGTYRTGPLRLVGEDGKEVLTIAGADGGSVECEIEVRRTVAEVSELADDLNLAWLEVKARPIGKCPGSDLILGGRFPPGQQVLYVVDGARVFRVEGERARQMREEAREKKLAPEEVRRKLANDCPDFLFPLAPGARFGDPEAMKRGDGRYQWVVREADPVEVGGKTYGKVFALRYLALTDDTEVLFVPGLGVVRHRYRHHGSVEQWDLRLMGFGRG